MLQTYELLALTLIIAFTFGSGLGYLLFKLYEKTSNKKGGSLCSITEEIGIDD